MKFLLPSGLPRELVQELARACVTGGEDNMPFPTQVALVPGEMTVSRPMDESGCLLVPWEMNGTGRIMVRSATLREQLTPYQLPLELARGKINQLRSQAFDWLMGGLNVPPALTDGIHQATLSFTRAVCQTSAAEVQHQAQAALTQGFQAAQQLVEVYMNQVFQFRHQRQQKLDTALGCQLGSSVPDPQVALELAATFHQVSLPFSWNEIEPTEGDYHWEEQDNLVSWAENQGFKVLGGALVDFSGVHLPSWLWRRERNLSSLAGYLCEFVDRIIRRYRGRILTWQVTAASNASQVLAMSDEELLWLTMRLVEAARQADPSIEVVVGLAQPWGEYMAQGERTQSPFLFADALVRTGLKLNALDLELVMGVSPRGSYCRDQLDVSRLLDLFTLLGLPVQVTLGYPSADSIDPQADSDLSVGAGHWHNGFSPDQQADWAATFARLILCKPYVRALTWIHLADGEPHLFPHCGLVDQAGNIKPALQRLRALRQEHLK